MSCIRRHIADRAGLDFETIECPRRILSCLYTADRNGVFLLDSVTALLQNEIFPPEKNYALDLPAAERCARELLEFVRSVRSVVLVSDYIFSDAGEYDPMTEQYRRALAGSTGCSRANAIRSWSLPPGGASSIRGCSRFEKVSARSGHVPEHVLRDPVLLARVGRGSAR